MGKRKPPPPSPGPRKRRGSVASAREMVMQLTLRLRAGHADAAGRIAAWLEAFPELRPECPALDDLAAKAEAAWARAAAFGDPLAERAARDEAAAMKAELLGPAPSVADRVLASAVVVAHLSYQRAAALAARPADGPAVQEARDRRLASAQRRLLAAVRGWEVIAGRKARGIRPKSCLKLFGPDPEAA